MTGVRYVVGTKVRTLAESCGEAFFKPSVPHESIHTPVLPIYYRDTRGEHGHGETSNCFTSSSNPLYATMYTNRQDAQDWNAEFLQGEGIVYRF